jgi:hypothetical protein
MSDIKWIEGVPLGLVNFLDGRLSFGLQKTKFCCLIHDRSRVCHRRKLLCTFLDAINSQGLWLHYEPYSAPI